MSTAVDVMNKYLDDTTKGDAAACISAFAAECVLKTPCVPPPIPKELVGLGPISEAFHLLFEKIFQEFRWAQRTVLVGADPEIVTAILKSDVSLRNGGVYSNDYCFVARIQKGKFVEYVEFFDGFRAQAAFESALKQ